jgi:hypothetical protein
MLRVLDARSGRYVAVNPIRRGILRISALLTRTTGEADWTGIRVLLFSDVLARVAEVRGLQALTAIVFHGQPPLQRHGAERAAGLFGIHPPAARAGSLRAAAELLGGPVDVHIVGPGGGDEGLPGPVARTGAARVHTATGGPCRDADLSMPAENDPLAIRLGLMSHPHNHPALLDDTALARASGTTNQWRNSVADWAQSPSRPVPWHIKAAFDAAFDDLDTPRVLTVLNETAQHPDVPDGAKFEAFAFADRVLGLELARDIGRPRQ